MFTRRSISTPALLLLAAALALAACGGPLIMDIRAFPSTQRAVSELQRGLADAVVGDYPVMAYEARESAGRFEVVGRPFNVETLGIGVTKGATALNAAVSDALRKIHEDKTYLNILMTWGVAASKVDPPPAPASVLPKEEIDQLKDGNLKVGMELTYPPMEFKNEIGREAGVDVELARAIGASLGVEVVLVDLPFDALIDAVETGKIDIILSAMTITDEREQRVEFIPYLESGTGILVKKGNPKQIRKPEDFCGKAVAVQGATSMHDQLKAQKCE
jgi:ABC-type amino acid transport substrate-binding protein